MHVKSSKSVVNKVNNNNNYDSTANIQQNTEEAKTKDC